MRLHVLVEGVERFYEVHVPRCWDGSSSLPLVIVFHGGGGTAEHMMRMTSWNEKADACGFFAIYPEGMPLDPSQPSHFSTNPQFWNDGTGREHVGRRNINDIGFVGACLDDVASRFPVDTRQVFGTGFSNGAFMVSRIGMELSHRFAAIAPVAGIYLHKASRPGRSVSVLCITGTDDPLSPLLGGEVAWPWGGKEWQPAVVDSVRSWAEMVGCDMVPTRMDVNNGVRAIAYGPNHSRARIVLYTVQGMGHTWPGARICLPERIFGKSTDKLQACDVIWDFFQQHDMIND
jgi:polyhydroxybutyrate depolymerase